MTEQTRAETTALNNYRIILVNGLSPGNVASPDDPTVFVMRAKSMGFIPTSTGAILWHAIATIELIGTYTPGQNVVPFGQQAPQLVMPS